MSNKESESYSALKVNNYPVFFALTASLVCLGFVVGVVHTHNTNTVISNDNFEQSHINTSLDRLRNASQQFEEGNSVAGRQLATATAYNMLDLNWAYGTREYEVLQRGLATNCIVGFNEGTCKSAVDSAIKALESYRHERIPEVYGSKLNKSTVGVDSTSGIKRRDG